MSLKNKRDRQITDDQERIRKACLQAISNLEKYLGEVETFTCFGFNSLLTGDGDIDALDLAAAKAEYKTLAAQIRAFIPVLNRIEAIEQYTPAQGEEYLEDGVTPNPDYVPEAFDPVATGAALAQHIADNNINVPAYSARFPKRVTG